jgi:small subunit ribosomal protein S11
VLKNNKQMSKFLKKLDQKGIIYILSTKNNTIITLTDTNGNTKFSTSAGALGFKNSRKSTTYAAQAATEQVILNALNMGYQSIIIKIKGIGYGKESCLRTLFKSRLLITRIIEQTPISHNGCRVPKKRRI